jgi:X-X-X-Leu-X-X-Gly heptad repeat protein
MRAIVLECGHHTAGTDRSNRTRLHVIPERMNPQLAQGVKQLQDQVQQLQAQNAQILEDIQEINTRLTRAYVLS